MAFGFLRFKGLFDSNALKKSGTRRSSVISPPPSTLPARALAIENIEQFSLNELRYECVIISEQALLAEYGSYHPNCHFLGRAKSIFIFITFISCNIHDCCIFLFQSLLPVFKVPNTFVVKNSWIW